MELSKIGKGICLTLICSIFSVGFGYYMSLLVGGTFRSFEPIQKTLDIIYPEVEYAEATYKEPFPYTYYTDCRITYYCNCEICNGDWTGQPTASGAMPTAHHTVAMESLPFGTVVLIDGFEYTVEDRGVYGDAVDIYVDTHEEAVNNGEHYSEVYIKDEE